ncbi:MAG: amino acid permease [archaeon]|nr:amino acid permease [archaeon]
MTAKLSRSLGLVECSLMGIGVILGAGIYALIGKAAALGGNAVWMSFIMAAFVAALTGLSYAELSSFIPKAGGEYYYAKYAFGSFVAYLVSWLLIVGLGIGSAAVALGFAGYFSALFGTEIILSAVILIVLVSLILSYGIKQSAWFAIGCTLLEIVGLLIILWIGLPHLGSVNYLEMPSGFSGIMAAAALIFFAYIGFEEIVQLAEETKNPTKNIPLALLISISVTTILYILVSLAIVSVVGWESLGTSSSPLADVAAIGFGPSAFTVLAVIALFSTANTVLIMLLSASRLSYGMSEDGSFPKVFSKVHSKLKTPYVSTFSVSALAIVIILLLRNIEAVANLTNFSIFITFIIINSSVIILRYKSPDLKRIFRIPFNVANIPLPAVLGILTSILMLFNLGSTILLYGFFVLIIGLLFYLLIKN